MRVDIVRASTWNNANLMPETNTEADLAKLAELTIAVYVEEFATDKRVLYIGDPHSRGPERLARVARSLDLISPQARVRGTRRGSRVQPRGWPDDDNRAVWDLVLVPDLSAADLIRDEHIERVASWLAEGGVLIAGSDGSPPPGQDRGLSYEDLFDLLQAQFDSVRMVGQAPFHAFSLVDLAPPGELEVTFDGSLLDGAGQRADRFVALCGDRDVVLDAYAVVQIPAEGSTSARPERRPEPTRREPNASEGRVSRLDEQVREQQDALDAAGVHAEELERELSLIQADLAGAEAKLKSTQRDLERAEEERRRAEAAAAEAREKASRPKPAPAAKPARAGDAVDGEEYRRVEMQLREAGRELTALQQEVARRGTLARDLIEELAEARTHAGAIAGAETSVVAPPENAERYVTDAVERAVMAEADKVELQFRLDEVRGELALVTQSRAADLEEMHRLEAALRGTVRGLNARLAEVTELHQQAQARLALSLDDAVSGSEAHRELQRQLAETQEKLESEMARASALRSAAERAATVPPVEGSVQPATGDGETMAAREGELLGALMQARDRISVLAQDLEGARAQLAAVRGDGDTRVEQTRAGYEARIAEVVAEAAESSAEVERVLVQNGELKAKLDTMERAEARLRGEVMGTAMRLADREEAVRALLARGDSTGEVAGDEAAVAELRAELTLAQAEVRTLQSQLDEATDAAEESREDAAADVAVRADSENRLRARDATIARLQSELTQATLRYRDAQRDLESNAQSLAQKQEEVQSARAEGAVEAEQTERELEQLSGEIERIEGEREAAEATLTAAKQILTGLVDGLPAAGAATAAEGGGFQALRSRIAQQEAEAQDREVLLRSLTAQLQERDDRIRALERFDPTNVDSPEVLKARLLELEERASRLAEELANERAN